MREIEFKVRVEVTQEQAAILMSPDARAFVEKEMSLALSKEWLDQYLQFFLTGPAH